jgi:glycosyltransferase involved in cell wall biosynthesis
MNTWCILTGEYPPDCGGVGDYTVLLAEALAASGAGIRVFRPPAASAAPEVPGVTVVTLPDRFGRASRDELDRVLDASRTRVLVQYVPNAFGMRGVNLPWCRWLLHRARKHGTDVRVMFHEPYFYFSWRRPQWNGLAVGQRLMAALLLRASREIYVSTDSWRIYLGNLMTSKSPLPITLPIPSTIPRHAPDDRIRSRRAILSLTGSRRVVGHFGTYGPLIAPMLQERLVALLNAESMTCAVCIGDGSRAFVRELLARHSRLSGRVLAFGRMAGREAAATIAACDLLVQPYPDGVTTRRTSTMAALLNGTPVVTTYGTLTEPIWSTTQAVAMVPVRDTRSFVRTTRLLLANTTEQEALGRRGEAVYRKHFAMEHTVTQLQARLSGEAA